MSLIINEISFNNNFHRRRTHVAPSTQHTEVMLCYKQEAAYCRMRIELHNVLIYQCSCRGMNCASCAVV